MVIQITRLREYLRKINTIDDDILNLEDRIKSIEIQMEQHATDYVKLQELMEEKHRTEVQLEEKMERWIYLNDLAEQIVNQK